MQPYVSVRRRAGDARRAVHRRQNALRRALSVEKDGRHLIQDPVFVLCSVRSGSTLLRSILDTHTEICAPQELHLATMRVRTERDYAVNSWEVLGVTMRDMENLLWDRALHLELVRSGKRIVVDKTPQNAGQWKRIHEYWPEARYLHLRRHPGHIYDSLAASRPDASHADNLKTVLTYGRHLDEARDALPGVTVRYEDLTTDPRTTAREICEYLGVRFQSRMLKYKRSRRVSGLGDWSAKIRSGRIQPHEPLPDLDVLAPPLRELAERWGY
jgi:hypothetical protein